MGGDGDAIYAGPEPAWDLIARLGTRPRHPAPQVEETDGGRLVYRATAIDDTGP
jgi:hypothetical protein